MSVEFDPGRQINRAIEIASELSSVSEKHRRQYPYDIPVVVCISGYGFFGQPTKPGEPVEGRWQGHDRIMGSLALVSDLTAAVINHQNEEINSVLAEEETLPKILGPRVTSKQIKQFGPLLLYVGTHDECEDFKTVIPFSKVPPEKIIIADTIDGPNGGVPITHSGHQFEYLFQQLTNPESPIYGMNNLAIVANVSQIRIPFYLEQINQKMIVAGLNPLDFWAYEVKNRPRSLVTLLRSELDRLEHYTQAGHLSPEPVQLHY